WSSLGEPLAPHPIKSLIKRTAEAIKQFVDLGHADDERGAQCQHIAKYRPHDQPFLFGKAYRARTDAVSRCKWVPAGFVRHQSHAANETEPARFPDQRMTVQGRQACLELWRP